MIDDLGFLADFVSESDPRSAVEQFDDNYAHGGGWFDYVGLTLDHDTYALKHSGDPDMHPIFMSILRDELILVYPLSWVVVVQPDQSYRAARLD
jgi:hypothetical protein